MKHDPFVSRIARWGLLMACLLLSTAATASTATKPVITSIQIEGSNVVVTIQVPEGLKVITLESRSRLPEGAWEPRLVQRLDGAEREIEVRLPKSANLELIRVKAEANESLPGFFYRGTSSFAGEPTSAAGPNVRDVFAGVPPAPAPDAAKGNEGATRAVVESDIWKIDGNTLYFFNQYRGLQVIDIANPDAPVVRGTLSLPAAGEQMYLLGPNQVVLLSRGCGWSTSENEVLIVSTAGPSPHVMAHLPVAGGIQESRMVGTALYVASETYRPVNSDDPKYAASWEWGTVVSAFDLANPAAPVVRETLWYPGYGNVVTATDRFLFVAIRDAGNWWNSTIRVVDISAPDGTMKALGSIRPAGQVADKFKMNLDGELFTVISEAWSDQRQWVTTLETFSLQNPTTPQKLGSLVIKPGERLFATRFDGNRVYVVTFLRIDPLFIVDLSDPLRPRIAGEVEVPGWSTYIQPWGDRLVTIGIDNTNGWRVAVSLFDVRDASKPALLSRVPMGENYSWSEATTDEKAFGVLPEIGLLLVPYQGYTTNGYASRVQLIDLLETNLVARGTIEHQLQPRRATTHGNRVLSLSGWELLTVDTTDRDHPVVKSKTELAWQVDRVFLKGDYLIELANGASWDNVTGPTLRVTAAAAPDKVLTSVALTNLPIIGATVRGDYFYIAQGRSESYWLGAVLEDGAKATTNANNLILTVINLGGLPQIEVASQTLVATEALGWNAAWEALWPKPGLLVWSGGGGGYWGGWGWRLGGPEATDAVRIAPGGFWRPWYGGGNGGRLLAFDVSNTAAPSFLSAVNLTTNNWWNFSGAFATDRLVYVSHQSSEFMPGVVPPGYETLPRTVVYDQTTGKYITNEPPVGIWVQRYYLDVVDYSDPLNPTIRKPVNIPGLLKGIAYGGALLYTSGVHYDPVKSTTDWTEWLDASAYDGVAAHLVDSLALSKNWPHPVLVFGSSLFIGAPAESTNTNHLLETWTLPDSGRFTKTGTTQLASAAQNMAAFGNLLVVQTADQIKLYNATVPALLGLVGSGGPQGCVWYDLSHADGALDRGVWLPLGSYGVATVPIPVPPPPRPPPGP